MYNSLLIIAAAAFALGGLEMKLSEGFKYFWPSLFVFVLFAIGAAAQLIAMRGTTMSLTYLIVLGLEAVLAFAFGALFFGETQSLPKYFGVGLVLLGVALLRVAPA